MALTEEQLAQLAFWNDLRPEGMPTHEATPQQTPQQAENFEVLALQHVFQIEGLGVPSEADLRAELRRMREAVGTAERQDEQNK